MLIRGESNSGSIELSEQEGLTKTDGSEFYRVTLRENAFEASIRVYAFNPKDDALPKFASRLADDSKGWKGLRIWRSLEGEFRLECEHDGVGHIRLTETIHSNPYGCGWTGQIRFDVTAGELEGIAYQVDHFFGKTA